MNNFVVAAYTGGHENEWDDFVNNESVNGTFLQTRNFLNYHPPGRFNDASLMVYHKNRLAAVLPACESVGERGKELYSHKGATYGGIIIKRDYYVAEKLIQIVKAVDEYVSGRYAGLTLKITADIHSLENSDLLQYVLGYCGYDNYAELNTYIDLHRLDTDILSSFDRNKTRNIKKCEKQGLVFRELENNAEIDAFHGLLALNLSKYGQNPVHTAAEMKSFKLERIPDNVKFYGVFRDQTMMAGGMMFVFDRVNVIHAQNLSADYRFKDYSPVTYMYYQVIKQAREDGYRALSWGISTENRGRVLNTGLIRNKESYGSRHQLNRTFYKEF